MNPCEAHVYVEDVSDAGVSQDEIDPGEKIHTVVVSAQVSGYAACERILIRIEFNWCQEAKLLIENGFSSEPRIGIEKHASRHQLDFLTTRRLPDVDDP